MRDKIRERGVVRWFHAAKGYGFIERPDGRQIFVHRTGLRQPISSGDQVEFRVEYGPLGLHATEVTRLSK